MGDHHPPTESRAVGQHLLVDMYGVKPALLTDEQSLVEVLLSGLRDAGFNVVDYLSHAFPGHPSGVTGVALLSESHATFHTYPEYEYMAMDIFSCGSADPEQVLASIVEVLQPTRVKTYRQARGSGCCVTKLESRYGTP
jgi:S-adenosylmethionine decarboxylase